MSNRPSILHVISNLNAGGAEKMVVTAANLFASRGFKVGVSLLVTKGVLCERLDTRVSLHLMNRRSPFDLLALSRFAELANEYDIVHVHLKHNLKFVFLANVIHGIKAPLILHDHSAEVLTLNVERTKLPFFVKSWLRKRFYIGVSDELLGWARHHFKLRVCNSFSLPNAIQSSLVQKDNFSEGRSSILRLVLVSNFRRIKNIEFAIELVKNLVHSGKTVTLDVYGQILDNQYYGEINELIAGSNLQKVVNIYTNVSDIAPLLPRYSLAIHCSKAETGPLVLLEYIGAGLPFVTTHKGEVANKVSEQISDLVVDSYSIEEWVDRISSVASSRDRYSQQLTGLFAQAFSIEAYFEQLLAIYIKVLLLSKKL